MKNRMKKFLRLACELVCLALVLCMTVGAIPMFAAEAPETEPEEEKPETIDIVVVIADVPQGTRINDSHVKLVTVPNYNIPSNVMTDISKAFEKYSAVDLYKGEYLYSAQLSAKRVTKTNNELLYQPIVESDDSYLIVTDYVKPNTGEDVSGLLQELIVKNPKKTLYFPDGEYVIANPLFTYDTPTKSTSFHLSDGAVIKASDKWKSKDGINYMIAIGGYKTGANDIRSPGSYYSFIGGTLDGNGEANGIIYNAGRETLVRDVCIKNVDVGIYIPRGSNSGSSDADFEDIVIYGTAEVGSKGFWVVGHDNTFTNIRIYDMETAIYSRGGTSLYKSIYAYNTDPSMYTNYAGTRAFDATSWAWFSDCVAENYATAFQMSDNRCILSDSVARWTSELCTKQVVLDFGSKTFTVSGIRAEFLPVTSETEPVQIAFVAMTGSYDCNGEIKSGEETKACEYVHVGEAPTAETVCPKCGGKGVENFTQIFPKILEGCMFDESIVTDDLHKNLLRTPVISIASKTETND